MSSDLLDELTNMCIRQLGATNLRSITSSVQFSLFAINRGLVVIAFAWLSVRFDIHLSILLIVVLIVTRINELIWEQHETY